MQQSLNGHSIYELKFGFMPSYIVGQTISFEQRTYDVDLRSNANFEEFDFEDNSFEIVDVKHFTRKVTESIDKETSEYWIDVHLKSLKDPNQVKIELPFE